jgi:glycosyltransferase involved in cell wall biosynthesis
MNDENQFAMAPDNNPFCKNVVLRRPEDFKPGEKPHVSLHLLVKNGASCIGRLLDNVGPYVEEIVAVVNDTTDRTIPILREYAEAQGPGFNLDIIEVTYDTHPELYILDVPETYLVGRPLDNEIYAGPFTSSPILADWGGIRNLGWRRCTKPWILFMDADDVIQDPESIPGICEKLQANGAELACSRYVYSVREDGGSQSESFRERLARNLPHISWVGVAHEVLVGQQKTAYIDGNLVVHDLKDNQGKDVRIPGRCFKILYHQGRSNEWNVPPRSLIYLAMEARSVLPDLAPFLLNQYLEVSLWPEERAWACCMRGEICEQREEYPEASEWYTKALAEHSSSKAAFRLCRTRFHECKWQECVEAFQIGVASKGVLQLLDNGPVYEDMSKILVTAALDKLGQLNEAVVMCREALDAFPHNSYLALMHEKLVKQAAKETSK